MVCARLINCSDCLFAYQIEEGENAINFGKVTKDLKIEINNQNFSELLFRAILDKLIKTTTGSVYTDIVPGVDVEKFGFVKTCGRYACKVEDINLYSTCEKH